jgi:hypothetical protein
LIGMVPISLLPETDRLFRSDILPHSVGIVPLSLFSDKPKVVKLAVSFPNPLLECVPEDLQNSF